MNIYLRTVLTVMFIVVSFGLVGPFLLSAPSDLAVIAGVVYLLFVVPIVSYYPNRKFVKNLMEK